MQVFQYLNKNSNIFNLFKYLLTNFRIFCIPLKYFVKIIIYFEQTFTHILKNNSNTLDAVQIFTTNINCYPIEICNISKN